MPDFGAVTRTTIDGYIDQKTISTPSNPSDTYVRIYPKVIDASNDGWFTKVKSGGSIIEVRQF